MAIRRAVCPTSLKSRVSRLESDLYVRETYAQRYQRAMLTQWLATSERGAELWTELEAEYQAAGSVMALMRTEHGRALILSTMDDLYAVADSISEC